MQYDSAMDTRPDHEIDTVRGLIDALGGLDSAAEVLGEDRKDLSLWMHRGNLPSRLYHAHQQKLMETVVTAPPSLWGQVAAVADGSS